jgi:O-acetyl-ADP-ribose deacetylase (regulator of RNase III)
MVTYITGDLMKTTAGALCNTVNTVGVMGKGIALQFKKAFPRNYQVYRNVCMNRQLNIGELLAVKDGNLLFGEKLIINFPTKTHWRKPSEYAYVEKGLIALRKYIIANRLKSLAIPAPGCGNGGLSYKTVKAMIENYLSGLDCRIEVYEPIEDLS